MELLRFHRLCLPPGRYTASALVDGVERGFGTFTLDGTLTSRGPHRFALR